MMEAMTAWVRNIILVVLFASFLELLLPNNSMQKFIRVIMGLFIMLAILNPILDFMDHKWDSEPAPAFGTHVNQPDAIRQAADKAAQERNRAARDRYQREMARQMRAAVVAISGIKDARVSVETKDEANGSFLGGIQRVTVLVEPGRTANSSVVKPVVIGEAAKTESPTVTAEMTQKVKRTLKELYQIDTQQIEVRAMDAQQRGG